MSVSLASDFTRREYRWTAWKAILTSKNFVYQSDDDGTIYTIWGYDGPEVHVCQIFKGTVPDSTIAAYSQSQNDSDKTDFVNNYLANSNKTINFTNIMGATDATKIGNTGDRLKVESAFSTSISTIPGISKLYYDDMNASNGGVARDTQITTAYTTIYNKSGLGLIFGFSVSFEGNILGSDEFILKFTVDSLVVAEISTSDIGTNALYNLGTAQDAIILGWQTVNNNVMFKAPAGGVRYNTSVKIEIKKASGSNKRFRAGLIGLTKE